MKHDATKVITSRYEIKSFIEMKNRIKLTVITLLGCYALPAHAIVNVENLRVGLTQPGLSGNLDLKLSGDRGNTNKDEYGIHGRIQNNSEKVTNFVVASYDYGEVSNVANTNKSFIHGRLWFSSRQNVPGKPLCREKKTNLRDSLFAA